MPWPTSPPFYIMLIAPLSQIEAVSEAFYMTPSVPLFTLSDAPIREVTHRAVNAPPSSNLVIREAQQTAVDAWIAVHGADGVSPEGVVVRKWRVNTPSPYAKAQELLGITTNNGNIS